MLYNGSTKIIKIGNDNAAYDSAKKIYQYYKPAEQEKDWSQEYLTFLALEDGTFMNNRNAVDYSLDNGKTWNTLASNTSTPTVTAGNKIMFKAELTPQTSVGVGAFVATGQFEVMGNPYSLLYGDAFGDVTDLSGKGMALGHLFSGCTGLTSAENLSLPATTLSPQCYWTMFQYCRSLTKAPKLPATTLANECYFSMFEGCTLLQTAPELPANTLANQCYWRMFYGCTSLNSVKMLATDITAAQALYNWLNNVSATGTFVKNAAMTTLPTGTSGIPSGWTVVDA